MSNDETADSTRGILLALLALELKKFAGETSFEDLARRRKGTGESVRFLAEFGLDAKDIAAVTGAPLTSVRTLLTPTRRK